jgi:hypothetical protein
MRNFIGLIALCVAGFLGWQEYELWQDNRYTNISLDRGVAQNRGSFEERPQYPKIENTAAVLNPEEMTRLLNEFVDIRWLNGGGEKAFAIDPETYAGHAMAMFQLQTGKLLSQRSQTRYHEALKDILQRSGTLRPASSKLKELSIDLRSCVVRGYQTKLSSTDRDELVSFYKQGAMSAFLPLRQTTKNWFPKVIRGMIESDQNGAKSGLAGDVKTVFDRMQGDQTYADKLTRLLFAYINIADALDVMTELELNFGPTISRSVFFGISPYAAALQDAARQMGISDERFNALLMFIQSDNGVNKSDLYKECAQAMNADSNPTKATALQFFEWQKFVSRELGEFARTNKTDLLSN